MILDITETVNAVNLGKKRWKNKVGPFCICSSDCRRINPMIYVQPV